METFVLSNNSLGPVFVLDFQDTGMEKLLVLTTYYMQIMVSCVKKKHN